MILRAPTGSYRSVLPKGPLDPASVIYGVSAGLPPRQIPVFQKIPDGVRDQKRPARRFSPAERRAVIGELVYSTKAASPVKANSGSQFYGYGQVLDFVDVAPSVVTAPTIVDTVTTKHNNSYIDLAGLGLDSLEQQEIAAEAAVAQQDLMAQIGDLQKQRASLEVDMASLQAQINEARKVLAGLTTILASSAGGRIAQLKEKLTEKLGDLNGRLEAATIAYSLIPAQIVSLRDSLTVLTDLVK